MDTDSRGQYVRLRTWGHTTPQGTVHSTSRHDVSNSKRRLKYLRPMVSKVFWLGLFLLSFAVNILLLVFVRVPDSPQLTYSPASPYIEYEKVVFSSAFGQQVSPFQGTPSDNNNRLWENLYDFGITRLSTEEARPMDNKTLPVPDEKKGYVVQLAVFHQLHCLNQIRKGIYGAVDMTNIDEHSGIEHLDHCIDMLRQAVMCNSDVTPLTFARTSPQSSMGPVAEVVHTCRRFSKIQQWAWERQIEHEIDKDTVVEDDDLGWGTYTYMPGTI